MVMEGLQEDMGDGNMQCTDHPYKNNTPGGICAFCLQEKLGKLVSSSFPIAVFPSSSSSSSPSFRSDFGGGGTTTSTVAVRPNASHSSTNTTLSHNTNSTDCHYHHQYYSRRSRIAFLLTQKQKKKKKDGSIMAASDHTSTIVFKRSKSTATPRRGDVHFLEADDYSSPQKRGFWSFLYLSKHSTARKTERALKDICYDASSATASTMATSMNGSSLSQQRWREKKKEEFVVVEENESPNQASTFDRKVSRSRSVGCGSRSFSGDFFERISTGFGDCTLRRVESQREGKPKVAAVHRGAGNGGGPDCIKERVKCGGIFSGFMITSSSSSSSSSSYWVSSSTEDNVNGKASSASASTSATATATATTTTGHNSHGRSKSWGWAFASPIRAFSKPSGKREVSNKNTTPNLTAIPSLLAVRG